MDFDILVIGGGHAGIEAAHAAAKVGARTALLTLTRKTIGQMSCNPAIGGIAKGHLVREIDALGGVMGRLVDETGIQFRMLNTRKGPAVRAPRAQADKKAYQEAALRLVASTPGLTILEGCADRLELEPGDRMRVRGLWIRPAIATRPHLVTCRAVVVCTGTFLNGRIFRGAQTKPGGRDGEPGPGGLAESFRSLGLVLGRLKTGTPPRLDKTSIHFDELDTQPGDDPPPRFSHFSASRPPLPQVPCHITQTNERTHEVIRRNIHASPLYSGRIMGRGPRYCPSIEDKVVKFPEKAHHLVFLEPEGLDVPEIYPNGVSTSLPAEVQEEFVRTLPGLEDAKLLKAGYAVEYDFVVPNQIDSCLAVRSCDGLFLAGQINGTSGYEEAAGQGLMAGINAALWVQGLPRFVLRRNQAYIGVMIDDLITKVPTDPYRMFTSNAEFRLMLRQDNADARLAPLARSLGLLDSRESEGIRARWDAIHLEINRLKNATVSELPRRGSISGAAWDPADKLSRVLKRPEVTLDGLLALGWTSDLAAESRSSVEAELKYEGYIARVKHRMASMSELDELEITGDFYLRLPAGLPGFSREATESLLAQRPETVGQASRMAGLRAAQIDLLCIYLKASERPAPQREAGGTLLKT
jgi:tRNA uridine 5-carboxymethylaminomethyl modification enzyme